MKASSLALVGLLAVTSLLTACAGDCKAIKHSGGQEDTTDIATTNGDCVVHAYAADSVGPKPK